jgi:phytoene synthase
MTSLAEAVRRHDPDRYFCALFAPAPHREALFTLTAFNHELARAQEVAREPTLALIRLQWWREVVEGADPQSRTRRHDVATPLRLMLDSGVVVPETLLSMIAAREDAVAGPAATVAAFLARSHAGPGALAVAMGQVLGARAGQLPALAAIGAAYGVAGTLRNLAALARAGQCPLPDDMLARANLTRDQAVADPDRALAACGALRSAGLDLIGPARPWPRAIVAAALPAALARRDLHRATVVTGRGIADRVAVLAAAMIRRA